MIRAALLVAVVAALTGCPAAEVLDTDDDGRDGEGEGATEGEGEGATEGEGEGAVGTLSAGSACDCDSDCAGTAENPGFCALGVCMQEASTAACAEIGGTAGCPDGSRCWPIVEGGNGVCWPDCDALAGDCGGACDGDGSCSFTEASVGACDDGCSETCATLTGGSDPDPVDPATCDEGCEAGYVCGASGNCMLDVNVVPAGPVPACADADLPPLDCDGDEAFCGELVTFDPRNGDGYEDYPLNGETSSNQYRSFIRRDLRQMIMHSAAAVACIGAEFPGNGGDLMLGDMSEEDGAIPGTSDRQPGHPEGTHERGYDMDIGYYQANSGNNILREVCDHVEGNADQYHCTSEPYLLDPWRTALFIGRMQESEQFRAVGVDTQVGPLLFDAAEGLCDAGFLTGAACREGLGIVFDRSAEQDIGWFYFHHHHFHVTIFDKNGEGLWNW